MFPILRKILLVYYISMEIKNILLVVIIIVLLYIVIRFAFSDVNTLTSMNSGTMLQKITAGSLATGTVANSSNFTYSIWFYKYSDAKMLYGRIGTATDNQNVTIDSIKNSLPCPAVILGAIENNLSILLTCFPGTTPASSEDTTASDGSIVHTCNISNVPIQKWVNLLVSVYGRTLDVYLDGKLVKTCVLPGVAKINSNADVYVTPAGGFSGWTAKFQYYPNSTDPQTAWNIYQKGYGASWLSNIFGKYQVKVAFTDNGNETGSFTI